MDVRDEEGLLETRLGTGAGDGGGARRLPNNGTDLLVSGEAH